MIVEIDGLRSVVHERGSGPTVVLMASMLIQARSYSRLTRRLARSFRVVTIDPPGTGRASRVSTPWSFDDYARRLRRTLDFLDLTDVTLIGHSNSAAVAILAAGMTNPSSRRIARIVLADSVGGDPRHHFWRIGLARVLDGVFEPGFSITALYDVFWNLFIHNANFRAQIDQGINWDAGPHAPRVRVPTLIAWGGRDLTFFPWCGRRIADMIAGSQLRVFPAHQDWLATHPADFAAVVEAFCRVGTAHRSGSAAPENAVGDAHPTESAPPPHDNDPCGLYGER